MEHKIKEIKFTPKYEMLQKVWHLTPEGDAGIIIDRRWSELQGITYLVSLGFNADAWCYEHELSTEKCFK